MKKMILAALSAVMVASALSGAMAAEKYDLDPKHVNITWHANHFGFSNPSGRFGITEGVLFLDEAKPQNSKVDVTIDVDGLVTGIPDFDKHLKSADFLNTEKHPTARFKSTAVKVTGKETAEVTGDLTLNGVTKPATLEMTLNKIGENPMNKKKTVGFTGHIVLKRSEYNISQYVPNVSDEVTIRIEAEAAKAETK